jgi:hypothetical protein
VNACAIQMREVRIAGIEDKGQIGSRQDYSVEPLALDQGVRESAEAFKILG